jgi:hypothetical protein
MRDNEECRRVLFARDVGTGVEGVDAGADVDAGRVGSATAKAFGVVADPAGVGADEGSAPSALGAIRRPTTTIRAPTIIATHADNASNMTW